MTPRGLTLLFTGDGKGKTTSALGLALRALGSGLSVQIFQFIKGSWVPGEQKAMQTFGNKVSWTVLGRGFVKKGTPEELDALREEHLTAFEVAEKAVLSPTADLVILDEILYLVHYGLLDEERVLELIHRKPATLHLAMTGRGATPALIEAADLVTEMRPIKHPYEKGIQAQPGIEF